MRYPFWYDKYGKPRIFIELERTASGLYYGVLPNTWLPGLEHGWGNGYVFIPEYHKYFNVNFQSWKTDDEVVVLEIHGGVTYENLHTINGQDYKVIGFDTAHCDDTSRNRPKEWVEEETKSIVEQIDKAELFTGVYKKYSKLRGLYEK